LTIILLLAVLLGSSLFKMINTNASALFQRYKKLFSTEEPWPFHLPAPPPPRPGRCLMCLISGPMSA
jgi:hypothetical protein